MMSTFSSIALHINVRATKTIWFLKSSILYCNFSYTVTPWRRVILWWWSSSWLYLKEKCSYLNCKALFMQVHSHQLQSTCRYIFVYDQLVIVSLPSRWKKSMSCLWRKVASRRQAEFWVEKNCIFPPATCTHEKSGLKTLKKVSKLEQHLQAKPTLNCIKVCSCFFARDLNKEKMFLWKTIHFFIYSSLINQNAMVWNSVQNPFSGKGKVGVSGRMCFLSTQIWRKTIDIMQFSCLFHLWKQWNRNVCIKGKMEDY